MLAKTHSWFYETLDSGHVNKPKCQYTFPMLDLKPKCAFWNHMMAFS
jgi:hypothetical protein